MRKRERKPEEKENGEVESPSKNERKRDFKGEEKENLKKE